VSHFSRAACLQIGRSTVLSLRRLSALLVTTAMLPLAACGDSFESPTQPAPLAPANVTQEFSGPLNVESSQVHPFPVPSRSTITVTLVSVAPLATLSVGLGVGTWDGTSCTLIGADNNARAATALSGTVEPGNYCAAIFDNGNLTESITYTIRVQRPGE
jgi:hypothetical protein